MPERGRAASGARPFFLLAHLLTHTAGFEDRQTGYFARNTRDLEPLGQWLAEHIPARVRPPGELTAYSNYGYALAGYIVEQVWSSLPSWRGGGASGAQDGAYTTP